MTHQQSLLVAAVAALGLTVGFTWAFGPWGLIGSCVVLLVAALLIPERERRVEVDTEADQAAAGNSPLLPR